MQFPSYKRELPAQPELSVLAEILIVLAWIFNTVLVSREMVKSGCYIVKFCTCEKRGGKKKVHHIFILSMLCEQNHHVVFLNVF